MVNYLILFILALGYYFSLILDLWKNSNPLLVLTLIFLTSFISYKYIENPFRKKMEDIIFGTYKIVISLVIFCLFINIYLGEARKFRYNLISLVTGNDVDPESFYLSQQVPGTTINRKNCHGSLIAKYDSFEL